MEIPRSGKSGEEPAELQNERWLWDCVKRGDAQALELLFRACYPFLYDYGIKLTTQEELVKDGIQEVFCYLWEKRKNLAMAESVQAYLLVSLRRNLLQALRKQRRRIAAQQEYAIKQTTEAFSFEDLIVFAEKNKAEKRVLENAVKEIPARMREALYLKTYDGLSYREIANIMQVRPQVARNYVSEAYRRLRKLLTRH